MSLRSFVASFALSLTLPVWAVDTGLKGVVGADGIPEARVARVAAGSAVGVGETIIALRRTAGEWVVTRTWAEVLAFLHNNSDVPRFVASVRRVDGGIAEVLVERVDTLPPLGEIPTTTPPPVVVTPPPVTGTVTPPEPERIVPPSPPGLEFKGRGSTGATKPVGVSIGSFFLSSGTLRKHQRDNFAMTLSYALSNEGPTMNETSIFAMFAGYKSRDDFDRASVGLTILGLQVLGGFGMGYAGVGAGVAWTSVAYDNFGTERKTDVAVLGRIGTFLSEERNVGLELAWIHGPRNANRGLLVSVTGRF